MPMNLIKNYCSMILFFSIYVHTLDCQSIQTRNPGNEQRSISVRQFQKKHNRVDNEYIVTLTKTGNIGDIKDAFREFITTEISNLGNNSYLVKIKKDPGPEIMTQTILKKKGIKTIQANFIYKTF